MRPRLLTIPIVVGLSLLAVALAAWGGQAHESGAPAALLVEYPVPFESGAPLNLAVESAGRIWFSMPESNAIGRLVVTSTTEFHFTQFDAPTPGAEPHDLAFDGQALWFTEIEANQIGRLDVSTGDIVEFAIPLSPTISITDSRPAGITIDPLGDVWFAERAANSINRFDPDTAGFTRYHYDLNDALPEEIAAAGDGNIWFTAPGRDRVVEYRVNNEVFASAPVSLGPGMPLLTPRGIALDNSGDPWATVPEMDMIGVYFPATFSFWRWYSLPGPGVGPTAVAYSRDNTNGTHTLWYAGSESGLAGSLTIDSFSNVVHQGQTGIAPAGSHPTDIQIDADEVVWIADHGGNLIATWLPPYYFDIRMPVLIK